MRSVENINKIKSVIADIVTSPSSAFIRSRRLQLEREGLQPPIALSWQKKWHDYVAMELPETVTK